MSEQANIMKELLCPKKGSPTDFVQKNSKVVLTYSQSQIVLKKVEKYRFIVGSFNDTSYKDEPDMLEEWEQFYLRENVKMEVIGVLKDFPCNSFSDELVLMVCEDGKVFAYEDELLHLVAKSLNELFDCGLQYPGIETYYRGQSFEDMTETDWDRVKKSAKMAEPTKEQQVLLQCREESYLGNLAIIKQRLQTEELHSMSSNEEQCGGSRRRTKAKKSPASRTRINKGKDKIVRKDHSFSHDIQPKKSRLKRLSV